MRRRDFIKRIAGSAAVMWPLAARAQSAKPVIGYLAAGQPNKPFIAAFHEGLREGGYVEGQTIAVEYRFANGQSEHLSALAADLVGRRVTAIFAEGGPQAALAAKQATVTIPIVFLNGDDPIRSGLVSSINRPEANVTGVTLYAGALGPKKLDLLRCLD
jgi:putative tryptophan/tyrosine transport system substrate-binding protein